MDMVGKGKYEPLNNEEDDVTDTIGVHGPTLTRKRMPWDHIQNLDQFFKDIYTYHQSGGFNVILLSQVLWIVKFAFITFIGVELSVCTRWEYVANRSLPIRSWDDMFVPPAQCWSSMPVLPSLIVVALVVTFLVQIVSVSIRLKRYWDVRRFCTYILDLPTTDIGLSDLTWSEVQRRLLESQRDFQLCVYRPNLNELDIYNRILRHTNYLIAMVNQDILPMRFRIPFMSYPPQYVFLSDGYLFNLKLILFWSPWSPFLNYWQLRAEYKWVTKRHELATKLATHIRFLGIVNFILSPAIFFAQLLIFACANAERLRYQPAALLGRRWSNYAQFYLRHFNELHHEFIARVSRAYEPASQYLDSFVCRTVTVLAQSGAFIFGGLSVAFFMAGLVKDELMHLPGYLALVIGGGLLARCCLAMIPDEYVVYCPRNLLISTLMRIHYMPEHWKDHAGTYQVRSEFAQLFQYRLVGLLEELLSPIITPFLLFFVLPNHTLEIVDFLRNYTVEVPGVGDVCSFAQLDIRRHGDPLWQPEGECASDGQSDTDQETKIDQDVSKNAEQHADLGRTSNDFLPQGIANGGKTELSLMHFHLTNPTWPLPPESLAYLKALRAQAMLDMQHHHEQQQQVAQFQTDTSTSAQPIQPGPETSTSGLFSSLYGTPDNIASSMYHSLHPRSSPSSALDTKYDYKLKNLSHLPGPGLGQQPTMGVVGAMVESMKSSLTQSMHRSDPGVARSASAEPDASATAGISRPESATIPCPSQPRHAVAQSSATMMNSRATPAMFSCSMLEGPTPVTMSLMAASALYSPESPGLPLYQPYMSQTEEGLSQQFGVNSSAFGGLGSRRGTNLTDVLTADMSVSALYIHELHHRRRQQRQGQQVSRPSQRSMIGSSSGVQFDSMSGASYNGRRSDAPVVGVYTINNPNMPYQIPHVSFSSTSQDAHWSHRVPADLERTSLIGSTGDSYGYGAMMSEPGIIRTSLDSRRIQPTHFAGVREEEEPTIGTPRPRHDFAFAALNDPERSRQASGQTLTPGIVTVSGSPSVRHASPGAFQQPDRNTFSGTGLDSDNDTHGPVWPDLPPTN